MGFTSFAPSVSRLLSPSSPLLIQSFLLTFRREIFSGWKASFTVCLLRTRTNPYCVGLVGNIVTHNSNSGTHSHVWVSIDLCVFSADEWGVWQEVCSIQMFEGLACEKEGLHLSCLATEVLGGNYRKADLSQHKSLLPNRTVYKSELEPFQHKPCQGDR